MNELVYYQDQYQKELESKVLKIEEKRILLDKTIFIPASNTEPGDVGKINKVKIVGSKKEEDGVWHILERQIPLNVGDIVKLELDWNKRLLAMRLHSALHLLAGPFDKNFNQRAVAGAIRGKTAHLVFKEKVADEIIDQAIEQANQDIENGLAIKSYWDEKREGFRWTQVGDYPAIPDGGLHIKNTTEIGKIVLASKDLDQGRQKVEVTFDMENPFVK
ncbi:MAG: alanyl-tRNA editing protein [Candidatus Gribaldobacteria bacterium]|nr:alanyl-tRNA editing protein [Candidatus Gribaldobacteria bacterium]